jgi:hypothetical protein
MIRIFIVEPMTGELLTAKEWKEKAGKDVKNAEHIVIVPEDGTPAFMIPKKTLGEFPWKEAKKKVAEELFRLEGEEVPESRGGLPTRKQFIDIRDARSCGLEQVLELIGGDQLLKNLRNGEWFWTSEVWIPAGTSAEDWSSSRYDAYYAWFSYGSFGYANYGNYVGNTNLALPLLLYDFREANV